MTALLAACAEPMALLSSRPEPTKLKVSVGRSALLGEYANPPLWVWTVDAVAEVATVEAALDGAPYRTLHPAARSFRPAGPLAPGSYSLTIRVTTAGAYASTVEDSAVARVAALPGRTPVPNDPCYPDGTDPLRCGGGADAGQWSLRQLRLPELWQALAAGVLHEPEPVVVAVLDTGYATHPDLIANLEAAAGYDFISDPNASGDGDGVDPDATDPATAPSHGTAIAGVIAARTGNGIGIAGIGWPWGRSRVTIMPVRVVGPRGATTYDVAQGLLYAAGLNNDSGVRLPRPAKIINLSLAEAVLGPPDEVLEDALRRVTEVGVIVVAAAGNHGSAVRAPANSIHTVAVGSVTAQRSLAATSNFGAEIDVVAPGGDPADQIPTLGTGGGGSPASGIVRPDHGTSIAAAHVSGVLALLAGLAPSLTLSDARALLAEAAVDLGAPGRDDRFGPGLLDAYSLVGAYPGPRSVQVDRGLRGRAGETGSMVRAGAAPGDADPYSLIVRLRGAMATRSAAATAGERVRGRHAVAGIGAGGYALVRLNEGQDREQVRAQLQADAEVAAVYDNRIYRLATGLAE